MALLMACRETHHATASEADSTRMVTAAIREFTPPESHENRACRGPNGERHRDTGQVPCTRAPFIVTRLVAFRRDSVGACVWIESVLPLGVSQLDGGPVAVPMARTGEFRRDAFSRGDCISKQPPNER